MLSAEVKNKIIQEYESVLSTVKEDTELFEMVIDYPMDAPQLGGLQESMTYSITHFFDNNYSAVSEDELTMIARSFINIEPFLKKLIHLINPSFPWEEVGSSKGTATIKPVMLLKTMKALNLLPNNIDTSVSKEEYLGEPKNLYSVYSAYLLRNSDSHELRKWNRRDTFENVQNVMITYLYACHLHRNEIRKKYTLAEQKIVLNASDYINSLITNYEKEVRNGFTFVPLKWHIKKDNTYTSMDRLWTDISPQKHVLLCGDAGCGKSTSINYLAYQEAKKRKTDNHSPVPVVIRLIDVTDRWFTVEDAICERLNISMDFCRKFLDTGLISVYLDGLNEMINSTNVKVNAAQQIEKFINTYQKTRIVISDRIHETIKIDVDCVHCLLKKMTPKEAVDYVAKTSGNTDERFAGDIEKYTIRLSEVSFTPILLNFLVSYYKEHNSFPETSDHLIYEYFVSLMNREVKEKKDINASQGRLDTLLMYLACQDQPKEGWSSIQVQRFFKVAGDQLGIPEINTEASLNLAIQFGILSEDENRYSFANEKYLNCFMAYADLNGVFDWD